MTLETLTPVPTETVSPIKPSEALRLGRLVYPERRESVLVSIDGSACALGAMLAGWGVDPWSEFGKARGLLKPFGLEPRDVYARFDDAEYDEKDGDAAVLAYLEERGL